MTTEPMSSIRDPRLSPPERTHPIRVAVVCDFREERWPSMDLVGEMLFRHLRDCCAGDVTATQLVPVLRRRFERFALLSWKLARNADRVINRFLDYPAWLRERQSDYDLFHVVDHSYAQLLFALPRQRTVVTCHDLDTFRCLLEPERESRPRWFRALARRTMDGFRQAAHVIAVSHATRDEILLHGLVAPERITVIPNGVHPLYSAAPDPVWDAKAAELMPDAQPVTNWLLSVGSTLPRKRLDILLRVFAAIHRDLPATRLVRVGGFTAAQRRLAAELNIEDAVVELSFLETEMLAAVYRRATLLLHTADAEGFGLPLTEAMACGCPVVASDIAVLREVGGTPARYCTTGNVDSWTATVAGLLTERSCDLAAWELRRQQGPIHAARFSWAENARRTAGVYQNVLEGR
jgi:glycosyltransferase involved in cell wall biosynthesis